MTICRFDTNYPESWDRRILNRDAPSFVLNEGGAMDGCLKKDKATKSLKKRKSTKPAESNQNNDISLNCLPIIEPNKVEFFVPIITKSESNTIAVKKKNGKYTTEHWTQAHKRHKKQKNAVFWAFLEVRQFVKLPCKIKYTRYAPRELDVFGNLPTSLKYVHDALCEEITGDYRPGRADSDKRISVSCDQIKSKIQGVKVIIEF